MLGREGGGVGSEELVFEENEDSSEEVAESHFEVVVAVAFEPLLHEGLVLVLLQNDLVLPVPQPSQSLPHEAVHSQQSAFLDLEDPLTRRNVERVDHLEHPVGNGDVLAVDQHEGRDEVVFFLAESASPKEPAVVDVEEALFLAFFVGKVDRVGFLVDLSDGQVAGQDLRVEEVDCGWGGQQGHALHGGEGAGVPVLVQLLLDEGQSEGRLPKVGQLFEVVDVLLPGRVHAECM